MSDKITRQDVWRATARPAEVFGGFGGLFDFLCIFFYGGWFVAMLFGATPPRWLVVGMFFFIALDSLGDFAAAKAKQREEES